MAQNYMENIEVEEENAIDLQELIAMLLKNIWVIVSITAVTTIIVILFTLFVIDKKYQSETSIYVRPNQSETGSINYADLQTNQRMVETYTEIIKSRLVLKQVIDDLRLDISLSELRESLTVSATNEIILIEVKLTDQEMVARVANKVAEVFMLKLSDFVDVDNLKVVDVAYEPLNPVSPNVKLNAIIGFILGGMISVGFVLLKEFLNRTIRTAKDVEKYLNLPVMGVVPDQAKA